MTSYDETLIRDRAYTLWEEAGRPEGQDKHFWAMAEEELARHERRDEEPQVADPVTGAVLGGLPTR